MPKIVHFLIIPLKKIHIYSKYSFEKIHIYSKYSFEKNHLYSNYSFEKNHLYSNYSFEKNSTLEIDFFIKYEGEVTALEVKSADNTKSKSLKSVMEKWNVPKGIRLSSKNLGITKNNNVLSLPIYMIMFL